MQEVHDISPYGGGADDAGDVSQWLPGDVPDPHPNGVAIRIADTPVVAHVLTGASLAGGKRAQRQRVLKAESQRPAAAIRKNLGDDECGGWREEALFVVC